MAKQIRVLLADGNGEFRWALKAAMAREEDLRVIASTGSGEDALRLTESLAPEVLVTGLVLSDLDGLGLLERLRALPEGRRPLCLVVSGLTGRSVPGMALRAGADYFMGKPCAPSAVLRRVRDLAETRRGLPSPAPFGRELEARAWALLAEARFRPGLAGTRYLVTALCLAVRDPEDLEAVTKVLYPETARLHDSTPQRVERSIRSAIDDAWQRGGRQALGDALGLDLPTRPTSREVIAAGARLLATDISAPGALSGAL